MATPDEFADACRTASRQVRRLPAELRRALSTRTRPEITEPLAARIGSAATGPHAALLSGAVKPRTSATPDLVIGGTRPRISGGASPRDVVFGDLFGGGSTVARIPARAGRRGHLRRSTRQFAGKANDFVFGTIGRQSGWVLDRYADIVDDVLEGVD